MLQITDVQQDVGYFDIIAETLRATNLGSELQTGKTINFERQVFGQLHGSSACCMPSQGQRAADRQGHQV